jgi:aspartyl protease family protein
MRHADFIASLGLLIALSGAVHATNINVVGLFGAKAVVSINGGQPRTLSVGQKTAEGLTLVAVDGESATFDVDGKHRTLKMGQAYASGGSGGASSVTLKADGRGHFVADGQINGGTVRFLVDTGATMIVLPAVDAKRLGINYRAGQQAFAQTANGMSLNWRVKLDTVRLGDITINNVDALVTENLHMALLGMSFLNRTEMKRDGETMVLTKRF